MEGEEEKKKIVVGLWNAGERGGIGRKKNGLGLLYSSHLSTLRTRENFFFPPGVSESNERNYDNLLFFLARTLCMWWNELKRCGKATRWVFISTKAGWKRKSSAMIRFAVFSRSVSYLSLFPYYILPPVFQCIVLQPTQDGFHFLA